MSKIYSLLLLIFLPLSAAIANNRRNNACNSFLDYLFINTSRNCYHDPDLFAQTPEIIDRHVGVSETHEVITEDGYILTVFRIPKAEAKAAVILQHPVTADSIVWVGQGDNSLAFIFWREGYDVWLPNHRGTYFSRKHVNLTSSDPKFWDFSFHEIGVYDCKAFVDFVRNQTRGKIFFVAHSMSSTSALVYTSLRPREAVDSIDVFVCMSPVAYLKHVRSPIRLLAGFTPLIRFINKLLNITHLDEYDSEAMQRYRAFAVQFPLKFITPLMLSMLQGWTPKEFDPALVNLAASHMPRTYPWKIFYHYVQQFLSGRFQMYDYGVETNRRFYNMSKPPEYPLGKILAPIFLIYSEEDSVAPPEDVELLYSKLAPRARIYGKLKVEGMNHVDFHYGKHRVEKVFDKILRLFSKIV